MTNIWDCYQFILFAANKYLNGYINPIEGGLALGSAQNQLFNKKVAERQNGNELALVALRPFYKTLPTTTNTSGFFAYPERWAETQAVYYGTKSVKQMFHNELQDALESTIYPITDNRRWMETEGGITVYPNEIANYSHRYLARPTTPVIGYTVSGNEVEYDSASSVQLEFDEQYWMEIIYISLRVIGVNLGDQSIEGLLEMYTISNANPTAN